MPDLSHLWQRFLLAAVLAFGLLLGIAATIFSYSNTAPVTVNFAVFRIGSVPLWSVVIVPLLAVLVAAMLFHWWNSLRQLSEHMHHRRRVHELEAEVSTLRAHLDQLLEMPDRSETKPPSKPTVVEVLPQVSSEPAEQPAPAAAPANESEKSA